MCMDTHLKHNIILNWMSDELLIKREEEQKYFKELSSSAEVEMPNIYSKTKIRPFGWNSWFMLKRKWQHASSVSYQLSQPFTASQEICQISQINVLCPLHLFPLHLLPLSPLKFAILFSTMHQVCAYKGHQWLYHCHIGWMPWFLFYRTLVCLTVSFLLPFYDTVLTIFYDTVLTTFCPGFFLLSDNSYLFFMVFFLRNVYA